MDALTLDEFLPYRLSIASNLTSAGIARSYRERFGLSIAEWRIVAVLGEAGDQGQLAIGRRTHMDKVTVSRAATALARRALIARAAQERDGRARLLSLTAEGRGVYEAIVPQALAFEARLLESFTRQERATLVALLRRIDTAALALER